MSDKVSEMTAAELIKHIKSLDESHRRRMKHLRALVRIVQDEEQRKS